MPSSFVGKGLVNCLVLLTTIFLDRAKRSNEHAEIMTIGGLDFTSRDAKVLDRSIKEDLLTAIENVDHVLELVAIMNVLVLLRSKEDR